MIRFFVLLMLSNLSVILLVTHANSEELKSDNASSVVFKMDVNKPENSANKPREDINAPRVLIPVLSRMYSQMYTIKVTLGRQTNLRTFEVAADTGSTIFWVPHENSVLTDENDVERSKYAGICYVDNPGFVKKLPQAALAIKSTVAYGSGSAKVIVRGDFFAFKSTSGSTELGDVISFYTADRIYPGKAVSDGLPKGFFGLDYATIDTPVIRKAVEKNVIKHKMFTIFLKKSTVLQPDDGGLITLGAHDHTNCGEIKGYTKVNEHNKNGKPNTHWEFSVTSISLINLDEDIKDATKHYHGKTSSTVITDSGNTRLTLGSTDFKEIKDKLGAVQTPTFIITVECDKKFEVQVVINEKTYVIPSDSLIVNDGTRCILLIKEAPTDSLIVLGQPFIRSWCHIHDWENSAIFFAEPKQPNTKDLDDDEIYIPERFTRFVNELNPTCQPSTSNDPNHKRKRSKRSTDPNCMLQELKPKSKSAPCKDKSEMCQHWKRNKFCKNRFFARSVKLNKCAKTCNLCK